jgi:hypothetical protein
MSHIARIACQVSDLDALAEALSKLNAELRLGQQTFRSYSGGRCEHAIRLLDNDRAYEIGLQRNTDQTTFAFAYDNWGPGQALEDRFGSGLVGLQDEYQLTVAEKYLRQQGCMVTRGVDEQQQAYVEGYL